MVKRSLRKKSGGAYTSTGISDANQYRNLQEVYATQNLLLKTQKSEIEKLNGELHECRTQLTRVVTNYNVLYNSYSDFRRYLNLLREAINILGVTDKVLAAVKMISVPIQTPMSPPPG